MSEHFTDLRLNRGNSSGGEESFWPSFTDIMTVIVMIFLIVMLVLLIKNMDLVTRLQATLEAERTATQQVETTSSLNRDLQAQLERTQSQLDMLRMQLMDMGEESDRLKNQLAQSRTALAQEQSRLEQEQTARQQEHKRLEQEQAARTALASQFNAATAEIASLTNAQQQQHEKLAVLEREKQRTAIQLVALQGEFSNLQGKYDKLIRPARTSRGKYVVKVRILRKDGKLQRFIRSPEQQAFEAVDADTIRQQLDKLHAAHPDDMYVRIIFPDDSGLSYSEAWKMTESLLQKYDYYYRAQNPSNPPAKRPANQPLDSGSSK